MTRATHQSIRKAIRQRIVAGEWKLGELIPGEVEFAEEYSCSRSTVNRALQALAEEGIVERKRKGGTRVRPLPMPQAQFRIPLLREQVEGAGHSYQSRIRVREERSPSGVIRDRMKLETGVRCSYLETLHLADQRPFAFERRWVNNETVPEFRTADLAKLSANEWLLMTVPFSRGDVSLSANAADREASEALAVERGAALFTMDRVTWLQGRSVTAVTLFYAPGFRLDFEI